MAKKHKAEAAPKSYTTPMTREGVGDPNLLTPKGQEAHYTRGRGPGKRSKNPKLFDSRTKTGGSKAA